MFLSSKTLKYTPLRGVRAAIVLHPCISIVFFCMLTKLSMSRSVAQSTGRGGASRDCYPVRCDHENNGRAILICRGSPLSDQLNASVAL